MSHEAKRTEHDFRTAFKGILLQMEAHGVEFTEETRAFAIHMAEVTAEKDAQFRHLQNMMHKPLNK